MVERALRNPELKNLHFDISWDETAKYIVKTPASIKNAAALINNYPDRFLFGTDEVAPSSQEGYLKVYRIYEPLLAELTDEARDKLLKGNYERLFDAANRKVSAWEEANKGALHAEPVAPTPISGYRYDRDPAPEPAPSD